jgi:hypothetical protein
MPLRIAKHFPIVYHLAVMEHANGQGECPMSSQLNTSVKVASLAVALFVGASVIPGQNPTSCVSDMAPHIKNAIAHLQYDSSVKAIEESGRFRFDRCVRNHKPGTRLFIDWVDTGAKGVTDKNGMVQGGVEWPSKDSETKKTKLIYGIARNASPSTYVDVKGAQAKSIPPGSLRSYAKMGLPVSGKNEGENAHTVDVDVEFESAAMKVGSEYLYSYSWRDRLAETRVTDEKIYVVWPEKFISNAIDSKKSSPFLTSSTQGTYSTDVREPESKLVTVEFHSMRTKDVVGTARVNILRPYPPNAKE